MRVVDATSGTADREASIAASTTSPSTLLRPAVLSAALAVAAAVPAAISGVRAVSGGWTPVIDNSVIAVRTHDVFGGHLPLVGIYTSLTVAAHTSTRLHHLGPMEYWLAAVPTTLGGSYGRGLVATAAAINGLAAAGMVWLGHRIGGTRVAALAALGAAVLAWSLGGQILHDPWNPHLAIFPFAFLLMAAWCVATGDAWMLPIVALAASLVTELHLTFVAPALFVSAWGVIGLAIARRRTTVTADATQPLDRPSLRWPVVTTVAVAIACWVGPIADQIGGSGNLSGLLHAVVGGNYATEGFKVAWDSLVHATSVPPAWATPYTPVVKVAPAPGAVAIATSVAVLVALLACTTWAWTRSMTRLATAGTTALFACAGALLTTAQTPSAYFYDRLLWARRVWWPVGVFVWMTLGYAAIVIVADRWGERWRKQLAGTTRWSLRSSLDGVVAAIAAFGILVAVVAAWPRLGPAQDYGSAGFAAVRALSSPTRASISGRGPWLMTWRGDLAANVVGPGLASELIAHDKPVVVEDANFPDFGSSHVLARGRRAAGRLLVASGSDVDRAPAGYRLVARWTPSSHGKYRNYRQTLFLVGLGPVAVYQSTSAG